MIKSFKIFEKNNWQDQNKILSKLTDQFDTEFIEDYHEEHIAYNDAENIISIYPSYMWDNFDDERFIQGYISDEKNSLTINEFSEYDYKVYLGYETSDEEKVKIIKLYKKHNEIPKDQEVDYSYDMLDDLTEKELKNIILKCDEEDDFLQYTIEGRYENRDAKSILSDLYDIEKYASKMYDMFNPYINDEEIVRQYKNEIEYDTKYDEVKERIDSDRELQDKLLDMQPSNVLLLAKVINNQSYKDKKIENIVNEYDFQKLYITEYVYENKHKDSETFLTAEALKFLYDKFDLHPDIEEEYKDDMWSITAPKFNM